MTHLSGHESALDILNLIKDVHTQLNDLLAAMKTKNLQLLSTADLTYLGKTPQKTSKKGAK